MRCLTALLVAVIFVAHPAHMKRVLHTLAANHEGAHGGDSQDPVQAYSVKHEWVEPLQPPLGNNAPRIDPPSARWGLRKIWSNLFRRSSADNQWQPSSEEVTNKGGEEKEEEPVADIPVAKEEGEQEAAHVFEDSVRSWAELAKLAELNDEVQEEEVKKEDEDKEDEKEEEDEKSGAESEESAGPQVKVEMLESPRMELTADEEEVIAAKAMLDRAEAALAAAQAALSASWHSHQFSWQLSQEVKKAKADAQREIDAAKAERDKARNQWYKAVRVIEKEADLTGSKARWDAIFKFSPPPGLLNFPLA